MSVWEILLNQNQKQRQSKLENSFVTTGTWHKIPAVYFSIRTNGQSGEYCWRKIIVVVIILVKFSTLSSGWSHIDMIIVLEVNHDQWNSIIMIIRIFSSKIILMISYSIISVKYLRMSRSPRQALQVKQDLWNQSFSETRTFSASKTAPKHQLRSWSFHPQMIWFHYQAAAHLYFWDLNDPVGWTYELSKNC